jgi:MFS transporter, DHA2 family, multidrug resistance protein
VLFSNLVMLPQFLQTLLGYDATTAGIVLSSSGLILLVEMPIVGQLTNTIQARYLVAFGWFLLAVGIYYTIGHLNLEISSGHAQWLRICQAAGLGFVFVPVTLAAYVGLPAEKSNAIAGMLNFMRNLGSSVGTSMVTTLVARRAQVHQVTLVAHTYASNRRFTGQVESLARRYGLNGPRTAGDKAAYAMMYRALIAQATTLAYLDTFALLAALAAVMCVVSFVLRKNELGRSHAVAE